MEVQAALSAFSVFYEVSYSRIASSDTGEVIFSTRDALTPHVRER